jgi:hypothetical protein
MIPLKVMRSPPLLTCANEAVRSSRDVDPATFLALNVQAFDLLKIVERSTIEPEQAQSQVQRRTVLV